MGHGGNDDDDEEADDGTEYSETEWANADTRELAEVD